ncbi:3-methyl-2-oxobutanoate hydroxymethyltransferase, partial [Phenoliferia sp. Uapishka_3]
MSTGSVGRAVRTLLRAAQPSSTFPVASTSKLILSSSPTFAPSRRAQTLVGCTCHIQHRNYSTPPTPPKQGPLAPRKKRTILDLQSLKRKKIPITVLTAHDYPSARFIEAASAPISPPSAPDDAATPALPRGIDICLVGDSLAMVACGYTSTTQLTLPELLFHCRSVARGCTTSFLIADMPFGTFISSTRDGVIAATQIIQEGHMDAVKIEGGHEVVDLVHRLTSVGIPVMGHVGLTPQRQTTLSGFRVQGRTAQGAFAVWQDALAIQEAGAFAIVLEAVPRKLGKFISESLDIPVIGIGAGGDCDGQVLVQLDMLGVRSLGKGPKFLKTYANLEETATAAVEEYAREVRTGVFPEEKHGYAMEEVEWKSFMEAVEQLEPVEEVE